MAKDRRGKGAGHPRKAQRRRAGAGRRGRVMPLGKLILLHTLALGMALLVYALPHHVLAREEQAVGIRSARSSIRQTARPDEAPAPRGVSASLNLEAVDAFGTDADADPQAMASLLTGSLATPRPEPADAAGIQPTTASAAEADAASGTEAPDAFDMPVAPELETLSPAEIAALTTPEPTPEPVGSFRGRFGSRFSGVVLRDKNCYHSPNLDVTLSSGVDKATGARYYVADIYIADITCLRTGFGNDTFGIGNKEWPQDIAKRYGSVVTINGDYYGARTDGVVIRNGTLYRNRKNSFDVCAIYWDGTMRVFSPRKFDAKAEMENGCYQAWAFGPMLLDEEGHAKTRFNSSVMARNPRTVIGYYEPGHYCFVTVDGRSDSSPGMAMGDLARLMESLGCVQAYNLDGGKTSTMCAGGSVVNHPYEGGRKTSDVIMIIDEVLSE